MNRIAVALFLFPAIAAAESPARPHPMMAVTANPLASEAAISILKKGGSAVDAAVAAQAVLGLVEPQSSGVGGGAFMLTYTASTRKISTYDGRETAPAADKPDLFMRRDGQPMGFLEAAVGGRAVGVPGAIAMLEMAQREQGRLKWADLFQPAIQLAENGYRLTQHGSDMIGVTASLMHHQPAMAAQFLPNGTVPPPGTLMKNPAYAATLRLIAANGANGLLKGRIASDIVQAVRNDANPGGMTMDDLASYRPVKRDAVCGTYETYQICSAAPPSAGGIAVLQTLGILQHTAFAKAAPQSVDADYFILEAERLAMADRDAYVGDPDFVSVPTAALVAPTYLAERAKLINPAHAMDHVPAGDPIPKPAPASQAAQPEHGTTDIAIVDGDGNAVSMTTTVEFIFGAQLLVDGFVLNNELTDFSFRPDKDGKPLANRVQGGKRPRSSMAPSIVLDNTGAPVLIVGSAGGLRIPGYVIQAILAALDWHMTARDALAIGHVLSSGARQDLEAGTKAAEARGALEAKGETVTVGPLRSGDSLIHVKTDGSLDGAADPRKDGSALGG